MALVSLMWVCTVCSDLFVLFLEFSGEIIHYHGKSECILHRNIEEYCNYLCYFRSCMHGFFFNLPIFMVFGGHYETWNIVSI